MTVRAAGRLQAWGAWDRAERLCTETMSWSPEHGRERMPCHMLLGDLAVQRGRYDPAADHFRQALIISADLGDRDGLATAYRRLGVVADVRGRYDRAKDCYRQAMALRKELGDHLARPGRRPPSARHARSRAGRV